MKKNLVIRFVCDGYYLNEGDDMRWISRKDKEVYSLFIKTSNGEISYSNLVEKICSKIRVDEPTKMLKISYFPFSCTGPTDPNYIRDDEDVMCYLMDVTKEGFRSILYVEVINSDEQDERIYENQGFDQVSREDRANEVRTCNETIPLVRGADDNDGDAINMYVGEPSQQNEDMVMENGGNDDYVDNHDTFENIHIESTRIAWNDGLDITVGQEFRSKDAIQFLIEKAGHELCFEYVVKKSEPLRYVVKCSEEHNGCEWYVRAARSNPSHCYTIRTHKNTHTCSRTTKSTCRSRRKGTPRLVASILAEDYPGKFDTPCPKNLIGLVKGRLGVKVSYSTAWRGRKEAAEDVRGNPDEGFMNLYSYMFMLKQMNPGTVSNVEVDEHQKFKYLFFALGVSIEGFRSMRQVIIVDATHIKTMHGGVLIVATAQDPDHHHYPIAFGVVDGEKDESWTWFFEKLKSLIPDSPRLVFMSDRNQSLIKAIAQVYSLSLHGYCIFHLSQNVKSHVSGLNKEVCARKFRECARAYTEAEFLHLYGVFSSTYPSARLYLDNSVLVTKWARCYFPGDRYNIDTTNAVESINGVFVKARKHSLLQMIDVIIEKMVEWFTKHRNMSGRITDDLHLVPFVENEIHKSCTEENRLAVLELNSYELEYSVTGRDGLRYLVKLRRKSCSCKRFDIDKYPCVHAIAAVGEANKNANHEIMLYELCSEYYMVATWILAYSKTIYPVPHINQWVVRKEIETLFAWSPDYVVKLGRRQETRFPSVGEHRSKQRKKKSKKPSDMEDSVNNDGDN